jgi:DNA invertase Pin-like site-specific DNA recombinase
VVLQLGGVDLTSPAGKMMLTMLGAVAEMERDLLVERTHSGLERAKAQGKVLGRPSKTSDEQRQAIKAAHGAGASVSVLAREYGISRASILNIVQ